MTRGCSADCRCVLCSRTCTIILCTVVASNGESSVPVLCARSTASFLHFRCPTWFGVDVASDASPGQFRAALQDILPLMNLVCAFPAANLRFPALLTVV